MNHLSASELAGRMTPGKGYSPTELGHLFKVKAKGITPTLTSAIHSGLIVGVKVGVDYKNSTRYFIAGTEPKKAEAKEPALYPWQKGELKGYDAANKRFQELVMTTRRGS